LIEQIDLTAILPIGMAGPRHFKHRVLGLFAEPGTKLEQPF
jgi:hypothetical protein